MASFDDLDGAFASLTDTLQNRYSPLLPQRVNARWLGALAAAAVIARDVEAWNALPSIIPAADPVVARIDAASRALASATRNGDAAMIAALDAVDAALAALADFLAAS